MIKVSNLVGLLAAAEHSELYKSLASLAYHSKFVGMGEINLNLEKQ